MKFGFMYFENFIILDSLDFEIWNSKIKGFGSFSVQHV